MEDYQPRFSRKSLNLLMLVTVGLIVLFNLPMLLAQREAMALPKPATLNINTWQTDSGAQVWFSPYAAEDLHLELWYRAGYQFDHPEKASLLAQLIKWQSKKLKLDSKVSLDQDFIKISLNLSNQGATLNRQIEQLTQLLYSPQLPTQAIETIRANHLSSASDELRHQLYGDHEYGSLIHHDRLNSITAAELAQYHQGYMHPRRLHVALVGDLTMATARVLMERILPQSTEIAATQKTAPSLGVNGIQLDNLLIVNWPKLDDAQSDLDMAASVALLKEQYGELVKWQPGLSNSLFRLQISRSDLNSNVLQGEWDSDMMQATKRQLALKWIRQTHAANSLSRHLIALNAYGLPQDYMHKQIVRLEEFDKRQWQRALKTLLAPAVADNS